MLHGNERIIELKFGFLKLAEKLGNISHDCRIMGLSCANCISRLWPLGAKIIKGCPK